jgi:hypothetical protein
LTSSGRRSVEIHRDPRRDTSAAYWWRYRSVERFTAPAIVIPLALPSLEIPGAALVL